MRGTKFLHLPYWSDALSDHKITDWHCVLRRIVAKVLHVEKAVQPGRTIIVNHWLGGSDWMVRGIKSDPWSGLGFHLPQRVLGRFGRVLVGAPYAIREESIDNKTEQTEKCNRNVA